MAKIVQSLLTPSVTLSPFWRVVRTVLQTIIAYGAQFAVLVPIFHLSAGQAAEYSSIVAGLVAGASVIQNLLEHLNVLPTTGGRLPSPGAPAATIDEIYATMADKAVPQKQLVVGSVP